MESDNFVLAQYLSRINYLGKVDSSFSCVKAVMQQHVQTMPFENIDVQMGVPISLRPEDIVNKMVVSTRGGYCYEHNGLFAMFLSTLGLEYQFVGCRPMFYPEHRPRTHIAIIVEIDGQRWLCDLGFGALGMTEPMNIDALATEVTQGSDCFRLISGEKGYLILQARENDEWVPQYGFNLSEFEWVDFTLANYFNESHPDSFFVNNLVVLIKTAQGRHTLLGRRLKSFESGKTVEQELDDEAFKIALKDIFKVPNGTIDKLMAEGVF